MSWTDGEAQAFAAGLIGMSEAQVRWAAAAAGVGLRLIHFGRSEWHTNAFQRHGVTVTVEDGSPFERSPAERRGALTHGQVRTGEDVSQAGA